MADSPLTALAQAWNFLTLIGANNYITGGIIAIMAIAIFLFLIKGLRT